MTIAAPLHRRVLARLPIAMAATLLIAAAPASVDDSDGGNWFYSTTGIDGIHQTTTGAGVRIAMVDGLINPQVPDLEGTNLKVVEPAFCAETDGGPPMAAASSSPDARHSTSMASIILGTGAGVSGEPGVRGTAPGAELSAYAGIVSFAYCPKVGAAYRGDRADSAFRQAVNDGADIIFAPGGTVAEIDDVAAALKAGAIVLGSGGNDGHEIIDTPAKRNGVVAIGALDVAGERDPDSATDPRMGVIAPGLRFRGIDDTFSWYGWTDGASNATAYTAGVLALVWSAHPDATGNQILQAMVRTTGGSLHEPQRVDDSWGYGAIDARAMMATDPTAFPDVNPFLSDDPGSLPTVEQVLGQPAANASAAPSAPPSTGASAPAPQRSAPASAATDLAPALVIGAAALCIIGAIAWILLARRRRGGMTDPPSRPQPNHR